MTPAGFPPLPSRLPLYTCVSPSHETLLKRFFLPSLSPGFELSVEKIPESGPGLYKDASWMSSIAAKAEMILRALRENSNGAVVFSDVDIRFITDAEPWIRDLLRNADLAVLQDSPFGVLGTGFMACRSSAETIRLWEAVRERMRERPDQHEQEALNDLWYEGSKPAVKALWKILSWAANRFPGFFRMKRIRPLLLYARTRLGGGWKIRLRFFPETFWSPGLEGQGLWMPGQALRLPADAVLHHANWTEGPAAKALQLELSQNGAEHHAG